MQTRETPCNQRILAPRTEYIVARHFVQVYQYFSFYCVFGRCRPAIHPILPEHSHYKDDSRKEVDTLFLDLSAALSRAESGLIFY